MALTPEQITDICDRIAEGNSLRAICRAKGLSESSVRRWFSQDPDAMAHSTRARELGCDALADECIELADEPGKDPADKRIRIDTRLRLIGKWSQRYADKRVISGDPENPLIPALDATKLSADALREILAARNATE